MLSKQARLAIAVKVAKRYISAKDFIPVINLRDTGLTAQEKHVFSVTLPYHSKVNDLKIGFADWNAINEVSAFLSKAQITAGNLHKMRGFSDQLQHVIADFQKNRPTRKEVVKDPTFEKIEQQLQSMNLLAMGISHAVEEFIVVLSNLHAFTEHGSSSNLKGFCTDLKHVPHYVNQILEASEHLKERAKPLAGLLSDEKAKLDALAIEDSSGVGGWFRKMFRFGSASIEAMFIQPILEIEKIAKNTLPSHGTIDDPAAMTKACFQLTEFVMLFEGFKYIDKLLNSNIDSSSTTLAQKLKGRWDVAFDTFNAQIEGLSGASSSYGVFFLNEWDGKLYLNFKGAAHSFFDAASNHVKK